MDGTVSSPLGRAEESHAAARNVCGYLATIVAWLPIFCVIYGPARFELSHPWATDDYVFTAFQVQSMLESGSPTHHPRVGMPIGTNLLDFPMSERWHFFLMTCYSAAFGLDAVATLNLHLILTFPLTALTCYFALRRLSCGRVIAFAAGQLYAFPFFHVYRVPHAFLMAYYLVPLIALVLIRLSSEPGLLVVRDGATGRWRIDRSWATLGAIVVAVLLGNAGVYYAFFACFFLSVVACIALFAEGRGHAAVACATLTGIIVACGLVNVWPTLRHAAMYRTNEATKHDNPNEAEVFGLRAVQMLLPPPGHPLGFWEKQRIKKETYCVSNESVSATLGVVGSLGFLALMAWPFLRRPITGFPEIDRTLATLNLSGFLLASAGGFGVVIAHWFLPEIRAYNRMSVYLAFFALTAAALFLQRVADRVGKRPLPRVAFPLVVLLGLPLALYDQNPKTQRRPILHPSDIAAERSYFAAIESTLSPQAMVFQLPHHAFPEGGPVLRHKDYDHLRAPLATRSLRWSYGAIRGRGAHIWLERAVSQPPHAMIDTLTYAGFEGVSIDRFGYQDSALEREIARILKTEPTASANDRYAFFDLRAYRDGKVRDMSTAAWTAAEAAARQTPVMIALTNFRPLEQAATERCQWADKKDASIDIVNESPDSTLVRIEMRLASAPTRSGVVRIDSPFWRHEIAVAESPSPTIGCQVDLPPGVHTIRLKSDIEPFVTPTYARQTFRIIDLKIDAVPPTLGDRLSGPK